MFNYEIQFWYRTFNDTRIQKENEQRELLSKLKEGFTQMTKDGKLLNHQDDYDYDQIDTSVDGTVGKRDHLRNLDGKATLVIFNQMTRDSSTQNQSSFVNTNRATYNNSATIDKQSKDGNSMSDSNKKLKTAFKKRYVQFQVENISDDDKSGSDYNS